MAGGGLLHSRCRVRDPLGQVMEQLDHSDHLPHIAAVKNTSKASPIIFHALFFPTVFPVLIYFTGLRHDQYIGQ